MVWGAIGQVAGAGTNWIADDMEARRQSELEAGREGGRIQGDQWAAMDEQAMQQYLEGIRSKRVASQRQLAEGMGSPGRLAAGTAARQRMLQDIQGSTAVLPAAPTRELVDPRGGGDRWAARASAARRPMIDARRGALAEAAGQRGMARYDTGQLDTAADTGIDLGRQVQERQRQQQLMNLLREKLVRQNELAYRDTGPSNTFNNLHALGSLFGAAGGVADATTASKPNRPPDHYQTMDHEPTARPIYNPYQATPGVSRPMFGPGSY